MLHAWVSYRQSALNDYMSLHLVDGSSIAAMDVHLCMWVVFVHVCKCMCMCLRVKDVTLWCLTRVRAAAGLAGGV